MKTPDTHGTGLTAAALDPLRYDGQVDDPFEAAGMLRRLMPEGVRVLDVGCGTGSATLVINEGKGNAVYGIEPDETRAAVARERGVDVYCGVLSENYLAEFGPFDAIIFADVLEHLPDPGAMLSLAGKGLKPGGCFLISVPNVAHWTLRLDLLRGRFDYTPYGIRDATHLRWFTKKTIEGLLLSQGLEILEEWHTAGTKLHDYWYRRPWKWIEISRRDRMLHWLSRRWPLLFGCQHIVKARKPVSVAGC